MKKNTPNKLWHLRRSRRQAKLKIKKTKKMAILRSKFADFERLSAPQQLNIFNASLRRETLAFIKSIRELAINGARKILLDFTCVRVFSSGATILLLAEISRLKSIFNGITLNGIAPRNSKAAQVMKQTGLAKILRMSISATVRDHDVINWKCAVGQGAMGEKFDEILGSYDGVIAEALSDQLYRGMTEAMTNAHHHAYYEQRGDGLICDPEYKPWWMFSQEKSDSLTVVFCDLGLGIPKTLPLRQQTWWERIKRFGLDKQGDGWLIQGAVKNSRSRTRKLHRGKGLRQIAETISSEPNGRVLIYSNHGLYDLREQKERAFDYSDSIMGTIIQWRMPLPIEREK